MNKVLNVVYTVDDSFIKQAAISIESVVENNKNTNINFYICTDKDANTGNFKRLVEYYKCKNNITFKYVDAKKYDHIFKNHSLDKWGSESYYIYWRLIAPKLIDVDKLIYIDADVLCLKEIFWPNLEEKSSGCVLDCVHPHYNDVLNIPRMIKLYNTGVMFIDVEKWNALRSTERMIEYLNVRDKYLMADQDIYSLCLQNEIKTINPEYNFFAGYDYYGIDDSYAINGLKNKQFYPKKILEDSKNKIIFYHCLDGVFQRPWVKGNNHPAKSIFKKYMDNSAFGDISINKKLSGIFVIEKKLEFLPPFIYNKMHYLALWLSFEQKRGYLKNEYQQK